MNPSRGKTPLARAGPWLFAGLVLFVLGFYLSAAAGYSQWDEAWFLQLLDRVTSGDVLYEEVWFSATPLAVYGGTAFTTLFGVEVLALKAYVILIFALITLMSCRIDRQLGSRSRFHLLLVLALLVYAIPRGDAPTTPLAMLLFLVSFSAVLTWRNRRPEAEGSSISGPHYPLMVGGAAAGLSFATKQNIGLLALSAFVFAVFVMSRGARAAERASVLLVPFLSFVFMIGAVTVPVVLSGGWDELIYFGFLDQGTYVRLAGVFYLPGLATLGELLVGIRSPEDLQFVYLYTSYLIPIAAFGVLAVARILMGLDPHGRGLMVIAFVTAGFLGMYPLSELSHLAFVLPPVLLGLGYGLRRIRPRFPPRLSRPLEVGAFLVLASILGFNLVSPVRRAASDLYLLSSLPHFRGVLNGSDDEARTRREARALSAEVDSDRPFLLFPSASVQYLLTGLDNPTRYDFPIAQVFATTGQQEVIDAIADGRIDVACLEASEYPLAPSDLERFVRQRMEPGRDVGPCTVYRRVTG